MIKISVYHLKILMATLVRERNVEGTWKFSKKNPLDMWQWSTICRIIFAYPPLPLENNEKRHVYHSSPTPRPSKKKCCKGILIFNFLWVIILFSIICDHLPLWKNGLFINEHFHSSEVEILRNCYTRIGQKCRQNTDRFCEVDVVKNFKFYTFGFKIQNRPTHVHEREST